ncbi:uncharacterized protein O3C94_015592 [Discoglossus pictus]
MEVLGATALLIIGCILFLLLGIVQTWSKVDKSRLPPGPTPLPILGNILQLRGGEVFRSFQKLSEKYGPVYTIHMGLEPVVVICGCDAVKEALITLGEEFSGRGHMPLLDKISAGHGVVGSNGERWKQLRRFSLMTLRNFGMGKRSIEERIQEEALFLREKFQKTNSQPVDPTFYFSRAVSNVICSVVFGDRFEYEDKEFTRLLAFINDLLRGISSKMGQMYNVYPKVFEKLPGTHNNFFQAVDGIKAFIRERVKSHQETMDPHFPRDFIDCFLIKMEQEKENPDSEFHMNAILNTTFDMFAAGTETVSTTLRYGLMILLKHPDVEERIHREIDQVIGRNRTPTIEDRPHMPYTDAVIHEIQRFIDLLPLGIPHKVTKDVAFRDYVIPKGTTIYPLLSSVLQDPKQFKFPDQFNPGHFLDDHGKLKRSDGFMPFSAGKRICAGEGLARMELFLFLTTTLQNFILRSPVDIENLDLSPELSGFGNVPRPYQLCFIPRSVKNRLSMEIIGVTVLLLIGGILFLLLGIVQHKRSHGKSKLPPGPTPLPILGNFLLFCGSEIYKPFIKLSEKYGPVYTIYMGSKPVVVINGCEAVKEALNDQAEEFSGRGKMPFLEKSSDGGHGVIASNGERWKQLRRFALMTLRNFGMGKRSIEERIQEEAKFLIEELQKSKRQPVDPTFYFSKAVSNVICSVVFGDRFSYEDKDFIRLLGLFNDTFKVFSSVWTQMYNVYPKIFGKIPGPHTRAFKSIDDIKAFVAERVKSHQETLDPNSPRDFIDCFLTKMEQEKHLPESEFHMDAALNITFDLFGAGTETMSTTLRYGLMIILKHPDVEELIHKEIDQVIGRNRAPAIEDRAKMPYVEAVIHEIQRFIDLIPLGLPHKVIRDVMFRGYFIPKGTTIYILLSSVLLDPKQFKYPEKFNPGHFLDENGKFIKNDGFMPFSSGKRICAGEGLARMELFLFLTTIFQNFTLKSPVDIEEIDLTPELSGLGNFPRPYQVCFLPR